MSKMLYLSRPLFALVLVGLGSSSQGQLPDSLHLTTGDVRIDYCDNDRDLAVAAVHVKVLLTNRGKQDMILSRKFGPDEDVRVADMTGAVIYSPHPSYYESERIELGNIPDDKMFEILKPGTSVERDLIVGFPISKDPTHIVGSAPPPGEYRISASRSTWPFYSDEARARRMRGQWAKYGLLVTAPVKIQGIHVQIRLPKDMKACEPEHSANGSSNCITAKSNPNFPVRARNFIYVPSGDNVSTGMNWATKSSGTWWKSASDITIAHEARHLFGFDDDYSETRGQERVKKLASADAG